MQNRQSGGEAPPPSHDSNRMRYKIVGTSFGPAKTSAEAGDQKTLYLRYVARGSESLTMLWILFAMVILAEPSISEVGFSVVHRKLHECPGLLLKLVPGMAARKSAIGIPGGWVAMTVI